jgi:hypothetical protein
MIYNRPLPLDPSDQGDLIDDCFILSMKQFDFDEVDAPRINVARDRVLVLTQACDLANQKISSVVVALVLNAQHVVEQGALKPADVRGPVRAARVYGWHFLPANADLGLREMIVDLRQLHTVRLDLLTALAQRGRRRARLGSLYRKHLAKHFADTYSRIGLPERATPISELK